MRNRPAGISAMIRGFDTYRLDRALFNACIFPVYIGYGDLSDDYQLVKAQVLAGLFGGNQARPYPRLHHFLPPEMIYTPPPPGALVHRRPRRGNSPTSHPA